MGKSVGLEVVHSFLIAYTASFQYIIVAHSSFVFQFQFGNDRGLFAQF